MSPDVENLKSACVLVVDDEPRLVRLVRANLESVGHKVLVASDGASALTIVETEQPDLILLDILLSGMDGYEMCQRVREFSDVPIIMLTAKAEESDKVKGFEVGADDYLTKPFSAKELLARVQAVLRRSRFGHEVTHQPLALGDLTIDFVRRRVTVRGREVDLTPTEYKLLQALATNVGRVMLHEELLAKVWGPEYRDEVEYLRVYIRYLRQKLEGDPTRPKYILSKPGMGYMLSQEA